MSKPDQPANSSEFALKEAARLLEPLAQILIAQGVGYTQLAQALKPVFMQAAQAQIEAEGKKVTDAAISLRSGIHRKDVRAFTAEPTTIQSEEELLGARSLSLAAQVFTRWLTDAGYTDSGGKPATLNASGKAPSFESLVSSISKDFSRRTVLDELVRLGLVEERGDRVVPLASSMVPKQETVQLVRYLSDNAHDHLAAGAANLNANRSGANAPFLENSVFADGLSTESVEQLAQLARILWQPMFKQMVDAANQRYAVDREQTRSGRMRLGVYFYSEPDKLP
jgi:Family of unknown function (DUF6502)